MARLFLSYATADKHLARTVFGWLTGWGHDVFFDRDADRGISIGEDWKQRLYRELGRVDAVVCVVTAAYLESMWCTAEVAVADSRGCRLLPLQFEPGRTHKLMERVQYAAFTGSRDTAREQLRITLRQLDAGGRTGWREGQNPYPGLKPFQANRSRLFFGRTQETRNLAAQLRAEAGRGVLVIFGPSGCGKSSLLRAGLLPLLRDDPDWLVLDPWQPRGDLLRQLAAKLSRARSSGVEQPGATLPGAGAPERPGWSPDELCDRLGHCGGLSEIADELLANQPGSASRLLIAIDQAEQLFTGAVNANRVAALGAALYNATAGPVRVVATLRSEFLDDFCALPSLPAERIETQLLGPLSPDMLRLAIEEPAKIAGLRLAPELVARLLTDTGSGEALPLLASALEELAEGRGPGGRVTVADYDDLGARHGYRDLAGVHAVLARRADRTLEAAAAAGALPAPEVLAGLVRLVTLDEAGRRSRRRVNRRALPPGLRTAFGVFVDHRLLTSDGEWVEVAHEALLTAWPPLGRAITEHGDALRAARSVEQAAAEWATAGRVDGYLWDDERYTAAVFAMGLPGARSQQSRADGLAARAGRRLAIRARRRSLDPAAGQPADPPPEQAPGHGTGAVVEVEPRAREFLTASRARILARRQLQRRRTARTVTVLSVFLALALIASGTAGLQFLRARAERDAATVRSLLARADELRASDPQLALRLALAARAISAGDLAKETDANLMNTLTQNTYAATLTGHTSSVFAAAFSPDGRLLATGDGMDHTVLLWNVANTSRPHRLGGPLTDHTNWVEAAAFSPDGRTLATASSQELILWDVTDPARPVRRAMRSADLQQDNQGSLGLVFTPDGHTLATTAMDAVTLWEVSDPNDPSQLGAPLLRGTGWRSDVAVSSNGGLLAVAANDQVGLWNIADPSRPAQLSLATENQAATSVAFDPSGRILAVGYGTGSVTLSDLSDPAHQPIVGGQIANAGSADLRKVRIHPALPIMAVTSNDAVRVWDLTDPASPRRTRELTDHTSSVYSVAFSPAGDAMATTSADNTVILWSIQDTAQPAALGAPLSGHQNQINAIAFGPKGNAMVTGSDDASSILWDLRNQGMPTGVPLIGQVGNVTTVAFDPTGRSVAAGGTDRRVVLWDVTDVHNPHWRSRLTEYTDKVATVAFSNDGRFLASADSNAFLIWWDLTDPVHPRQVAESFPGQLDFQSTVSFSPDWLTMVSGGHLNHQAILRDITDLGNVRPLSRLPEPTRAVAFHPDGQLLAVSTFEEDVSLWNIRNPARPRPVGQPLQGRHDAEAIAFSPDGQTLAIGGKGTMIWNVSDPERAYQIGETFDTDRSIKALAFAPDGRTLATGDIRGKVQRWDLSMLADLRAHLIERACERARRGFTAEEWSRLVGPGQAGRQTCPART